MEPGTRQITTVQSSFCPRQFLLDCLNTGMLMFLSNLA
jgi:hypothetical protein